MSRIRSILSIIFHTIYGVVCIQLTHFSYDDFANTCTWPFYQHQNGSMTHLPLFRSWNNDMRRVSFYILTNTRHGIGSETGHPKTAWSSAVQRISGHNGRPIVAKDYSPSIMNSRLPLVGFQCCIIECVMCRWCEVSVPSKNDRTLWLLCLWATSSQTVLRVHIENTLWTQFLPTPQNAHANNWNRHCQIPLTSSDETCYVQTAHIKYHAPGALNTT